MPQPLALVAFYAALFALACIPLFSVSVLPLGDALNHMARIYILNNLQTEAALQKYYSVRWDLFSFQSADFLLPPLARWFGLEDGLRVFVVMTFALLIAGTVAVHRVLFRRVGLWPAAVFLFLYNFALVSGQISYLFSTGLGLLLFASWLATEHWPRAVRVPLFALASFGLMLCHFFALAAYALLVVSFTLGRLRRVPTLSAKIQRLSEAGLPFVVPAICFLSSFGQAVSGKTAYGEFYDRAITMLVGTLTYGGWPDIVLTVALIVPLWFVNRQRRVALAADMRVPTLVLVLSAIAMPNLLMGVFAADTRLPALLYFLLVAASDVRLEGRGQVTIFAIGVVALLALRVGTTMLSWSHFDADYREFRAADAALEPGSRVLVAKPGDHDYRAQPRPQTPYWFVGCFAVIDRQAFVPFMYTVATPLKLSAEGEKLYSGVVARGRQVRWHPTGAAFAALDAETIRQADQVGQRLSDDDVPTSTIDWSDWPERFDYLVDFDMGKSDNPVPALLAEVRRGSYFTIYRIHPP